jgi:hypothetical protein
LYEEGNSPGGKPVGFSLPACSFFGARDRKSGGDSAAERLLPADTLLVVTVPDCTKMRDLRRPRRLVSCGTIRP